MCGSQRQLSGSGSSPPAQPFLVWCQTACGKEAENTVLSFGSRELYRALFKKRSLCCVLLCFRQGLRQESGRRATGLARGERRGSPGSRPRALDPSRDPSFRACGARSLGRGPWGPPWCGPARADPQPSASPMHTVALGEEVITAHSPSPISRNSHPCGESAPAQARRPAPGGTGPPA